MTDLSGDDEGDQHDHGCKHLIRIPASWQAEAISTGLVDAGGIWCCPDGERARWLYTPC